jgi:succinate dehydrogenase / fumarate reductase membrane anchor subunit
MAKNNVNQPGLDHGKGGAGDWIVVRLNSFALLVVFSWLLASLLMLPDLGHATVLGWLRHPLNSVLMIALVLLSFQHSHYGLKEVMDDYVHEAGAKVTLTFLLYTFTLLGASFGVWFVMMVQFGGA